jgi:hypothetical protein
MRRAALLATVIAWGGLGCSARDQIALDYQLVNLNPLDVIRVETRVAVDPSDPRDFFADQGYRSIASGVGYEVRDLDQSGRRTVLITHDATLGYTFTPAFRFTLLPPTTGTAPPLIVSARAYGPTDPIGQSMILPATFGAGRTLAVAIPDARCAGIDVCAGDEQCCAAGCVRPLDDPQNCGGCARACGDNESCSGGNCHCGGASACPAPTQCCAVGCVNTMSDTQNCGSCGHACVAGEVCTSGTCKCGAATCAAGQTCCSGTCMPAGVGCTCNGSTCAPGQPCCDGTRCADTTSSAQDCGGCNMPCAPPFACVSSICGCNGFACVPGDSCCTSGCANLTNDINNCGTCGHACVPGETCGASACHCGGSNSGACQPGQVCCGSCTDTQSDENNCGACGHHCKSSEQCVGGGCSCDGGRACIGNETCCPGSPSLSSHCYDLSSDPNNCGSCGKACLSNQACMNGRCMNTACDPACTVNGNQCDANGTCTCNGGPRCDPAQGLYCCPTAGCVRLDTPQHCGTCANVCGAFDYCCGGSCTPPSTQNCTGCGMLCLSCCICPGLPATCAPAGGGAGTGCTCPGPGDTH